MSIFTNMNINVENVRMTYTVKWMEYAILMGSASFACVGDAYTYIYM
jgi:hypothetical protein